jgi:hypothetical protein
VLKAAFLVDEGRSEQFQAQAAGLIEELEPLGIAMEVSGPWPGYSFTGDGS